MNSGVVKGVSWKEDSKGRTTAAGLFRSTTRACDA